MQCALGALERLREIFNIHPEFVPLRQEIQTSKTLPSDKIFDNAGFNYESRPDWPVLKI